MDRMISVDIQGKPFNVTVIQAYAPTNTSPLAGQGLESTGSVVVGARAQLLGGMWDLPGPG